MQGQQERLLMLLLEKPKCTTAVARKITRDLNVKMYAIASVHWPNTEAFQRSRRERQEG